MGTICDKNSVVVAAARSVLGSSLRRCLSQLVYPPEVRDDLTIQEKLKLLEGVLKDRDFIGSVMRRVHKVFTKTAEEQMREGWQAVLERGRIAGAGCYRKALFNKRPPSKWPGQ